MPTFELVPSLEEETQASKARGGLAGPILAANARWFTQVRWIVVGVLASASLIGRLASAAWVGFRPPWLDLAVMAAALAAVNAVFLLVTNRFAEGSSSSAVVVTIWLQIVVDLLFVTYLVHIMGSTETFIAFTYLFHIALACIFFPRGRSILVLLLSCCLYLATVALEGARVWPPHGVFPAIAHRPSVRVTLALSAVIVWFVVWYLVSTLSQAVRDRDARLSDANERLLKAAEEKNQQILITTHDLKSPFAGIESNIEVLRHGFWNELPAPAQAIVDRIDQRAQVLSARIKDILLLGELKSRFVAEVRLRPLDLGQLIRDVVEQLAERAQSRRVAVRCEPSSLVITSDRGQLSELISNLVANAISYSREGGRVEIDLGERSDGVALTVKDEGIGIRADALPHIFDEYYRTNEAARFNRMSTGLGLAIVKVVAQRLKLTVRVSSEEGRGTVFEVVFPGAQGAQGAQHPAATRRP